MNEKIINKFKQHIPDFIDAGEPFEFDFNTTEELLNNEWINNWSKHPFDFKRPSPPGYFHRYSLSDNALIVELKKGYEWYVIGYILYPELVDLPKRGSKEK